MEDLNKAHGDIATIMNKSVQLLQQRTKSLMVWTETPEQAEIVKAIDAGLPIRSFTSQDDKEFTTVLGEWRVMLGDPRQVSQKALALEFLLIIDFVKKNVPLITLHEIRLARDLSLTGSLNVNPSLYNNQSFSVNYVMIILKAYMEYKKDNLAPVIDRWHRQAPAAPPRLTADQELEDTRKLFRDEYVYFQANGVIYDPFYLCFSFLKRTGRIPAKIATKLISDANAYGANMATEFIKAQEGDGIAGAIERLKSATNKKAADIKEQEMIANLQLRFSRNYCVQEYFRKLKSIDDLVNSFTVEEMDVQQEEQKPAAASKK